MRTPALVAAFAGCLHGQNPPVNTAASVEAALRNYPSIRVSREQVNAAAAGIQLARTAYLPRIDSCVILELNISSYRMEQAKKNKNEAPE